MFLCFSKKDSETIKVRLINSLFYSSELKQKFIIFIYQVAAESYNCHQTNQLCPFEQIRYKFPAHQPPPNQKSI